MGLWETVKSWFGFKSREPTALDVMRDLKNETRDPEWERLTNRFATLVFSEADQQRLWRRAHHGAASSARLLSGIRQPTPDERQRLSELVSELERGR